MAHNIHGSRFIGFKTPAWHLIGQTVEEPTPAIAAYEMMGGYDVVKLPAAALGDGETIRNNGAFFVARTPTTDDPAYRFYGKTVVGEDWVNVSPARTAEIADMSVRDADGNAVGVETMGSLGFGERMFISYKMDETEIAGETVIPYAIYLPAFEPGVSHKVIVSTVRVVCQNTMRLAISGATDSRNFPHIRGIESKISEWLSDTYDRTMKITRQAKVECEKMAAKPITMPEVRMIVNSLYPLPKPPQADSAFAVRDIATRQATFEANIERMKARQDAVIALWDGAGIGSDSPALRGTAYGLYQAVCEHETYRAGKATSVPVKLLEGDRGDAIINAYVACMKITA